MKNKSGIDFKSLFEAIPGLYIILLPDFTIFALSDAYEHASMTKRNEIIGKGMFEIFPDNPDDHSADGVSNLRASLNYVLKNKATHTMAVQKYDIRKPDGAFEIRYWSPLNKPVLNSKEEVAYIIHRVEDVTEYVKIKNELALKDIAAGELKEQMEMDIYDRAKEIHRMNSELEKKVIEIETANKGTEQFAFIASHDLQEPLRTIANYVGLFHKNYKGKLDKEADQFLDFISIATGRMQTLIKDLLNYSRIGKDLNREEVNCNTLLKEVLNDLANSIKESGAEIHSVQLPVINSFPTELKFLFRNLISNAIKFRKKDTPPIINITAQEENKEWLFAITDNGIGIDKKYYDKIFVIFQRLHNKDVYQGTGIGLAECKKIVEMHGGKIWVESKTGKGSVFYFTIQKPKAKFL
ncbi:MAG: GHKL domain-containing protein [Bacteroidetes bacterium]|nr:GHKL domain-containing protein [Bacteroidota bacterium]